MKIRIISIDIHGESYNREFELKEALFLGNGREYLYEDEHGLCRISYSGDRVAIYRKGAINSRQVFSIGKKTGFTYITKEFRGKFEVLTRKMSVEDGKIIIEYDIMDRNEKVNSIELIIILSTEERKTDGKPDK